MLNLANLYRILMIFVGSIGAVNFHTTANAKDHPGYWVEVDRVVDGDTFWAEGVKYRVLDIDTPETQSNPRHGYKCDAERRLGNIATRKAEALLLDRKVWIKPRGEDRYKRTLARVRHTQKEWYGPTMIELGVAAKWTGRKHKWCEQKKPPQP